MVADIDRITVEPPTLWNGKWRLHGAGNIRIWFLKDNGRPKRDRIFFATVKSQWMCIGFAAKDADRVEKTRDEDLIRGRSPVLLS
jgi:hypothetical protein